MPHKPSRVCVKAFLLLWHTFLNWIQFTPKSPPSQVVLCTWPSGNHESERISHFLLGRPHWFGEFSLWSRSVFTRGITSGNIIGCEMSVNKSGHKPRSWNCRNVCGVLSETDCGRSWKDVKSGTDDIYQRKKSRSRFFYFVQGTVCVKNDIEQHRLKDFIHYFHPTNTHLLYILAVLYCEWTDYSKSWCSGIFTFVLYCLIFYLDSIYVPVQGMLTVKNTFPCRGDTFQVQLNVCRLFLSGC